jgi:hypothetical protein
VSNFERDISDKSFFALKDKMEKLYKKNYNEYHKAVKLFYPNIDRYEYNKNS